MDLFENIIYTVLKDNFEMLKITIIIYHSLRVTSDNKYYLYYLLYPGLKLKLPFIPSLFAFTYCFFIFKIAGFFR